MKTTKKQLIEKCRTILYSSKITDEDKIFLKELLESHPDYQLKRGCGIKDFFIKKTIYGTLGFNIIRVDGSKTDFSFLQCISPKSNLMKIKNACRNAIRPTIKKIKTNKEKVIHHNNISFDKIVSEWLSNKKLDLTLNTSEDNNQETYFLNSITINSFIEFHNKNATLQEITIQEHKYQHHNKQ
jgi:hypothetical protein